MLRTVRYPKPEPEMNPEQTRIVTSPARWNIVIAGPGSGKSTVIVERAKYLVEHEGADPAQMAFVTFTSIGAKVLRRRLADAVGKVGFVGTLHAMMLMLLRREDSRWVLIGEDDADAFLQRHARLMGYKGTADELARARTQADDHERLTPALRAVRAYRQFMRSEFMLDFDMVLTEGLRLLSAVHSPNPWPIWFVDEFQDSSPVDAKIYLAASPLHLFVVGDPDQSIYAFRGARPDNITDYWADWRFTKHVMSTNYRCAPPICAAANAVIAANPGRIEKLTVPAGDADSAITVEACDSDDAERLRVGMFVQERIAAGVAAQEIAVLCRTNSLAYEMQEHLAYMGVPVASTESDRKPKDWPLLLMILTMIATPNSWAIARLLARAMAKHAKHPKEDPDAAEARVTAARGTCSPASLWAFPSMQVILGLNADFSRYGIGKPSHALLAERIRLFRPETDDELISCLREPGEVRHNRGVSVLTVHAAKGEEWTTVAMPGAELYRADDAGEMLEERRLAFVAITRARRYLFATCARRRRVVLTAGKAMTVTQERQPGEVFDLIQRVETPHAVGA